ncbi:MAG: tRNA (guanosine(46)-N7)-methyltransferase TrmB [Caulobacterales bacterium]
MEAFGPLRTFGRAKGRPLSARQQGLIEALLPHLEVPLGFPGAEQEMLDPAALFDPAPKEIWLEIGFGGGEHLLGQAERHPDIGFVAAEPFEEGIAKALVGIEEKNLANIRLHMGDARDIVGRLADASIARAFILFADPWPKTRHHKRRLIQPDFIAELARVIRPGGALRLATDWADYAEWMLERMLRDRRFVWTARSPTDWKTPPGDHVTTRYQTKGLGDMAPVFFDFERVVE